MFLIYIPFFLLNIINFHLSTNHHIKIINSFNLQLSYIPSLIINLMTVIIEEILFRYLFWCLDTKFNVKLRIYSSLIFAFYHIKLFSSITIFSNITNVLLIFLFSYYLYIEYNLLNCILIHLLNNILIFHQIYYYKDIVILYHKLYYIFIIILMSSVK